MKFRLGDCMVCMLRGAKPGIPSVPTGMAILPSVAALFLTAQRALSVTWLVSTCKM